MNNMTKNTTHTIDNIIIPLPGGSNPFWQGDWEPLSCARSKLLKTFSQRILTFYDIDDKLAADNRPLMLTFIDRREKRRLIDQDRYFARLNSKFSAIEIQLVDFASLSFLEQLKKVRRTDILVGVHGAGLTHGIFLPPGSTMVEILPPDLKYKGFRNLAKMLGHNYFSSHGVTHLTNSTKGDWQFDDVYIEEDRFIDLMDLSVRSMYHRGLRDTDVN